MAAIPQTASGVVNLATREGIGALQRRLRCSRRQAEQVFVLAQRALANGDILDPADIPVGTVTAAQNRQLPTPEPAQVDLDAETRTRAAKIRALPDSERRRTLGELEAQMCTHRRNIREGTSGASASAAELAHLERIRDLAAGVAW